MSAPFDVLSRERAGALAPGEDRALTAQTVELDGHTIELSNRDKTFFPDAGLTKGDVVDHYPDWIELVEVEKKEGGAVTQAVCGDAATLVYLANQAALTLHTWLARTDRLRRPDRLVFDLDPPESGEGGFGLVADGARAYRELMEELGLAPFVMTPGSTGLHAVVPIERRQELDGVRAFARGVSELLARREPDRFTVAQRKEKRDGRLFLDDLRNAYGQTSVAPYAVRARPATATRARATTPTAAAAPPT